MKSKVLPLAITLICLAAPVTAQDDARRQVIVSLRGGGFVAFRTETARPETNKSSFEKPELQGVYRSQVLLENDRIHRWLVDTSGRYLFGYDVVVTPNPAAKKFRIAVRPLDPHFESELKAQSSEVSQIKISTLPESTELQILDDGDAFALDLLINQKTGVKIVDIVKVSFDRTLFGDVNPATTPRDFTLDAVMLAVSEYRLIINNEEISSGKPRSSFAGALIWFYVEGYGRFIFSLVPREGYQFEKIGTIEDNKIEFTAKGKYFKWWSSAPILSGGGIWNVWVLHDPQYVPFGSEPPARNESNKLDELEASIKAAREKIARRQMPEPSTLRNEDAPESQPKRFRVMVGGADRIENLWPKN